MHEIITLQLGHAANYVGTHFWNTQESYFSYGADAAPSPVNHDVHFRPGLGIDNVETFTPRCLVYDLKGGFGSLRKINALYQLEESENPDALQGLWDKGTKIQREPAIPQTAYQENLDAGLPPPPINTESVRYWSDFNRVYYHPRSSVQINEYTLNSSIMPFENWNTGRELFGDLNREFDILDRDFRMFAEECDQMQGVQILAEADGAWGGFASEYINALRDEYSKTGIVTWGLERGGRPPREKQIQRAVSLASSLASMVPLTSLYIPLLLPIRLPNLITLDPTSSWHTSALLSTAIETSTFPTRLRDSSTGMLGSLNDLSALLNVSGGQKIATLALEIYQPRDNEVDERVSSEGMVASELSSAKIELSWDPEAVVKGRSRRRKDHVFARAEVVRGLSEDPLDAAEKTRESRSRDTVVRPAAGVSGRYFSTFAYPIPSSFPAIFPTTKSTAEDGTLITDPAAVRTCISTNSGVISRLKEVRDVVGRCVGVDEREALVNELAEIEEVYVEGWQPDDESDDDD